MQSPMVASAQITAADVSPFTLSPVFIITPAPKNPIPLMTPAAILALSASPVCRDIHSDKMESMVAEPQIKIRVLIPTTCWRNFRSNPKEKPAIKARKIFNRQVRKKSVMKNSQFISKIQFRKMSAATSATVRHCRKILKKLSSLSLF